MAISYSVLTQGKDTSDRSSYSTASITPTAGKTVFVFVSSKVGSGNGNQASLSGNNITWEVINSIPFGIRRLTVFKGKSSSPSTGAISISFSGQGQIGCAWGVVEFTNANYGKTPVQNVESFPNNAVSYFSVTMGAFSSSKNATMGCFFLDNTDSSVTAGSGFTKIVDQIAGSGEDFNHLVVTFKDTNDTSVDINISSQRRANGIGYELSHTVPAGNFAQIIG